MQGDEREWQMYVHVQYFNCEKLHKYKHNLMGIYNAFYFRD